MPLVFSGHVVWTVAVIVAIITSGSWATVILMRFWRVRRVAWRLTERSVCCAACDFDLTGTLPERQVCPECGASLESPKAVRRGPVGPSRVSVIGATAALAMVCFVCGRMLLEQAASVQWQRFAPTSWLIRSLGSPTNTNPGEVLAALAHRIGDDAVDAGMATLLIDQALAVQGNTSVPWDEGWGELFESAWRAGLVSDEQIRRYTRQAVNLRAYSRDPSVGQWSLATVCVAASGGVRTSCAVSCGIEARVVDVRVDGTTRYVELTDSSNMWTGAQVVGTRLSSATFAGPGEIGAHELSATVEVRLCDTSTNPHLYGPFVTVSCLSTPLSVVQREAGSDIFLTDDSLAEVLKAALMIQVYTVSTGLREEPSIVSAITVSDHSFSWDLEAWLVPADGRRVRLAGHTSLVNARNPGLKLAGDPRAEGQSWVDFILDEPEGSSSNPSSSFATGPTPVFSDTVCNVLVQSIVARIHDQMPRRNGGTRVYWSGEFTIPDVPVIHCETPDDPPVAHIHWPRGWRRGQDEAVDDDWDF